VLTGAAREPGEDVDISVMSGDLVMMPRWSPRNGSSDSSSPRVMR
jgi:hypothetical protein